MQIAIEAPPNSNIRYIEELVVCPTREADVQAFAYTAVSAIAAAYVIDAHLFGTIAPRDCGSNTPTPLREADQLRLPLDIDADLLQLPDEESLMIVLCIRQREGIGADAIAEILETDC